MDNAAKWLAPGTTSLRSPGGSDQLRSDSSATVTASAHASTLLMRVLGETIVGANCLRAVTTEHTSLPHRPLSRRRRATSAPACWPRTDWSRARSDERRVGKELVSTSRTRGSPYHYQKKKKQHRQL